MFLDTINFLWHLYEWFWSSYSVYSYSNWTLVILIKYVCCRQLLITETKKINEVLNDIGLVVLTDKFYAIEPSQLYYHKHNIIGYSSRNNFSPKLDVS